MTATVGDDPLPSPPDTRVDVLGVPISAITLDAAVDRVTAWVESGAREYVCVTGVHGVVECQRDPALLEVHRRAGMVTPDGMPMVWSGRWAGAEIERVYGPDLMLALCERASRRRWGVFLYGGREGVPERLAERLVARYPGLRIVGTLSPPFRPLTEDEDEAAVAAINAAAPDLVWVGLSTPKQERWMADHVGRLRTGVLLGVGAAFDIHAGVVRQAPRWMQRAGLEWLFRLLVEPGRLWRRYLRSNPRFVVSILRRPPSLRAPVASDR